MYLHLVFDNGFLNYFIELTENICGEGKNKYVIAEGVTPLSQPTRNKIKLDFVAPLRYNTDEFNKFVGNINDYEKVFIHFLSDAACEFVLKHSNSAVKFYWLFWGADLYRPLKKFAPVIYDDYSLKYYQSHTTYNKTGNLFFDFLKYSKRTLFSNYFDKKTYELRQQAIQRIDFFCHYNPLDLELLNRFYPTKAKFQPFFYFEYDYSTLRNANASDVVSIRNKLGLKARTVIQVGHSASLSNNHISVLNSLSKYSSENIQVVCPLSYGDASYGKKVIETGRKLFGEKFIPLTDYLSKGEYHAFLSCIDISIMNHKRTEAAGNVFMILAMEKTVYINRDSNLFGFLNKEGVSVFETGGDNLLSEISSEKRNKNRVIIIDIFSREKAAKNISNLCLS